MAHTTVNKLKTFLEMIKFEHSLFALPFAYLGLILAREPRLNVWLWVTVAMISFRTMSMALNRVIDRFIDQENPRTQTRALPQGIMKPAFVWQATFISFFIFEWSAFQLGGLCLALSPIPVCLTILYPYAKRFTWFSHFILGIILGIAPYGAWIASQGAFAWAPGFLMIGVASWVAGFDIIYALQDVDFDRQFGLFSIPARFSEKIALRLTRFLHVLTLAAWAAAGWQAEFGFFYFLGVGVATVFLFREHWLVKSFELKRLEEAFFKMNAIISLSVFFFACADVWIGV